jgi:phosphoribosylaminoimidazole-succinocarboxamide synthase
MSLAHKVLAVNDDLPIRTNQSVHSGKVRSVYWLSESDSRRLINERGYNVANDAPLAIMVISDRISAFECIWRGEGDMRGIPGKGAALNAISNHWFKLFKDQGLAESHILDVPHPLVWIVQKAKPVMIEAICRQYITGSMWRAYEKGERDFCGIALEDGLGRDEKLSELLITPSTKGILTGIPGVPEVDDVNISRTDIERNIDSFKFGYVTDAGGNDKLIYMDEVGTPDSSRIWDGPNYRNGKIIENSKEGFRQLLLNHFPDPDILLNKNRMDERYALARNNELPEEVMMQVSQTYVSLAEKITETQLKISEDPKSEILAILDNDYGLIY